MKTSSLSLWLLAIVGIATAASAAELRRPGEAVRNLGVVEYAVAHDGATTHLELRGEAGTAAGILTIRREDGRQVFDLQRGDRHFTVLWSDEGVLEVTTWSGAFAVFQHSKDQAMWVSLPEARSLADRHFAEIQLIGEIAGDLAIESQAGLENLQPSVQERLPPGHCCPECFGGSVRGEAYGSSRSYCCAAATSDANFLCWNGWCTGCCGFLDCDAVCSVGDYFCYCGRTGFACSGYFCE